jgi:hypothetical protein
MNMYSKTTRGGGKKGNKKEVKEGRKAVKDGRKERMYVGGQAGMGANGWAEGREWNSGDFGREEEGGKGGERST